MEGSRIAVIGSGYVGTTVAACLAGVGHSVVGVEIDRDKLDTLRHGRAPFHEPGLNELLERGLAQHGLRFTHSTREALAESAVVFVCVGAPMGPDARPDMRSLEQAAIAIGEAYQGQVVVNKSTIPVGGARWLSSMICDAYGSSDGDMVDSASFPFISNPEFLREGSAVQDFLSPHRIVLGGDDPAAIEVVAGVYRPILEQSFPGALAQRRPALIRTTPQTAEVIKFASNAFLATKISFANEMANICERVGADIAGVSAAMGLDPRIGPDCLRAGIGWGGSCLAKDLSELIATAEQSDYPPELLRAAMEINRSQRHQVVKRLSERLRVLQGRRICLLGLAFKPGTDDVRDAPAVEIARELVGRGAVVAGYDPMVRRLPEVHGVRVADDPYEAATGADATVLATEWPEFAQFDLARLRNSMRGNLFIDGRNFLDGSMMAAHGFDYESFGRSWQRPVPRSVPPPPVALTNRQS